MILKKVILFVALGWSGRAFADTLLPATAILTACGGYECEDGEYHTGGPTTPAAVYSGSSGMATASVSAYGPTVSAYATYATESEALLKYYFQVSGPANTLVPITIQGSESATSGPHGDTPYTASYSAEYVGIDGGQTLLEFYDCSNGTNCGNGYFYNGPYSISYLIPSNTAFEVELAAVAEPDLYGGDSDVSAAVADPFIQIDPDFSANNPGFSLGFSPGVVNAEVSATPEPSSLMLFGTGMIGAFGIARHRIVRRAER